MTWAHDDRYVAPARERPETAGAHILAEVRWVTSTTGGFIHGLLISRS